MENRIFSVSPFVGDTRKSSPRIWNFFAVQLELALFSKLQIPSPQHQWRINWKFSLGTEFVRLPNLIRGWDGKFPAPVETQKSAELSAIWRWLRRRQMIIMFEYVKPYSRARRSHRSWRLDSRLWSITLRSHESCRWHCELFSSCRLPRALHSQLRHKLMEDGREFNEFYPTVSCFSSKSLKIHEATPKSNPSQ